MDTKVFDAESVDEHTFKLYQDLHHKAAGRITRPSDTFEAMYEWVKSGRAILAGAKVGDQWVGFILAITYKDGAYYGSSANDPEFSHLPVSHAIQWAIIRWLKSHGYCSYELGWQQYGPQLYDFPSEKEVAISLFKRGFGGEAVPLFRGEKYYSAKYFRQVFDERIEKYASFLEHGANSMLSSQLAGGRKLKNLVTTP
jgi:hypothetical protein